MFLKKYIRSFSYAISGIAYAFRSQFNMRFHVFTAVLVLTASVWFRISPVEWCIILLCISSVFAAELLNTSIELNVDIASPGRNEKAGHAKDLAAAAVLVVCVVSAIIGIIVFLPRIIQLF
jgi:diacylglycerol kinase